MARKKKQGISQDKPFQPYCHYCGASVGETSDRTQEQIYAVYDCLKCRSNYCHQCSYGKEINGKLIQMCLCCDSKLDKVT
jgi:hypothetical protein